MKIASKNFLSLFFNEGESICVSHNQYAYHSVLVSDIIQNNITMISPNNQIAPIIINENDISLVSINPITGFRNDENVTTYRSFLVELDDDTLANQKQYVKDISMPYSVCIFSGNKSLHFGIVVKNEFASEFVWRTIAQWILNIMTKADQQTKNPSRCIRFPGHMRKDGKKREQKIIEIRDRITKEELFIWLNKFEDKKPQPELVKPLNLSFRPPTPNSTPKYIKDWLEDGVHNLEERNAKWFLIALSFAKRNFTEEDTVEFLENYLFEQPDFKRKEWRTTIGSAYKHYYRSII